MRYLTLALLLALTGCVTGPNGRTLDTDRIARVAGRAAFIGATIDLRHHPEHRAAYEAAVAGLKTVEAIENPDGAALAQALAHLPIAQLESDEGLVIVEVICSVQDELQASAVPLQQPELVRKTAPALRSGLERALAGVPKG